VGIAVEECSVAGSRPPPSTASLAGRPSRVRGSRMDDDRFAQLPAPPVAPVEATCGVLGARTRPVGRGGLHSLPRSSKCRRRRCTPACAMRSPFRATREGHTDGALAGSRIPPPARGLGGATRNEMSRLQVSPHFRTTVNPRRRGRPWRAVRSPLGAWLVRADLSCFRQLQCRSHRYLVTAFYR